jgi:mycothiol maleylpyruvate isomerase-like protein
MIEHDIEARLIADWEEICRAVPPAPLRPGSGQAAARVVELSAPEHASRVALVAELEDLRRQCVDLRDAIEQAGATATLATSSWTVRDVVAHLASWAMETRHETEVLLDHGTFDYTIHFEQQGGPRVWNQREVDARAGATAAALFDELDRETQRLDDLVLEAPAAAFEEVVTLPRTSGDPPAAWRMPLAAMIAASCWHARLHLGQLEEILRRSG